MWYLIVNTVENWEHPSTHDCSAAFTCHCLFVFNLLFVDFFFCLLAHLHPSAYDYILYMFTQVSKMVVQEDPGGKESSIHWYVSGTTFASNIWWARVTLFEVCHVLCYMAELERGLFCTVLQRMKYFLTKTCLCPKVNKHSRHLAVSPGWRHALSQVLHSAALEEVPSREVGGGSSADGNLTLGCTTTKLSQQTRYAGFLIGLRILWNHTAYIRKLNFWMFLMGLHQYIGMQVLSADIADILVGVYVFSDFIVFINFKAVF